MTSTVRADWRQSDTTPAARSAGAAVPALGIAGLSHSYGARPALKDAGFSIDAGDFTVLLGLNGAGKSTLFSLVTRLYAHQSGSIAVFGTEIDRDPATVLSRMGVVFQQSTLDLDLTVGQNLAYHAALQGMPRRLAAERIAAELERVDLTARRQDKARQLSGGQRRRVEIARALLHQPKLLLLDEPTVGLDVEGRRFLLDHVRRLCREDGIAVLWATHLIDEVVPEARLVILHRGAVMAHGPVPEILGASGAASVREAFDALTRGGAGEKRP
jgi:ABC-2 type transport system ATP-binding protein